MKQRPLPIMLLSVVESGLTAHSSN